MTVLSLRTSTITKLADISRYWAGMTPDGPALTAGGRHWTYAELEAESRQVAHGLAQAGVTAGDRIAFLDKNSPEYFTHLFGSAKLNAVSVAVNWRLAPPEIEFILNDAHAKVIFLGEEFLSHWSKIEVPSISQVIVIGDPGDSGLISYADWIAPFAAPEGQDVEDIVVEISGDDTCYQLYTSGTTGLPKGSRTHQRQLVRHHERRLRAMGLRHHHGQSGGHALIPYRGQRLGSRWHGERGSHRHDPRGQSDGDY